MMFRRHVLNRWTRDIDLGHRVVRVEWHPLDWIARAGETLIEAPVGVVRIEGALSEGEAALVKQLLEDDRFVRAQA